MLCHLWSVCVLFWSSSSSADNNNQRSITMVTRLGRLRFWWPFGIVRLSSSCNIIKKWRNRIIIFFIRNYESSQSHNLVLCWPFEGFGDCQSQLTVSASYLNKSKENIMKELLATVGTRFSAPLFKITHFLQNMLTGKPIFIARIKLMPLGQWNKLYQNVCRAKVWGELSRYFFITSHSKLPYL